MKHLFILNPVAGRNKNRLAETEQMLKWFAAGFGAPYEVYVTKAPKDATEKVAREAESGTELRVYACGGDGTLNECVCGAALRANVSVTHFPCGTGNDFIKMFGKEDALKFRSLSALADGTVRAIDLIECNGRYGINICSVGIDARIGADVHKYSGIPLIGGAMGYVTSLVVNVAKGIVKDFKITSPEFTKEGSFSLICACNGRFYGGGFNPVPDAEPDDGMLDFLIVDGVSLFKLVKVIGKYSSGRFRELGDIVKHVQGRHLEISSQAPFIVNIDGEILRAEKVNFTAVEKGVNFIFPRGMEYFDQRGT